MKWWVLVMVFGFKSWGHFDALDFPGDRNTHFPTRVACERVRDSYNENQAQLGGEIQYACVAQKMRRNDE